MSKHPRGFTLVEILVVVGIIALLSALLFPVLSRARESGRTKVCLSNMKQLGLAFQQYVQDAGRKYPYAGNFQAWADGGHWVAGYKNYSDAEHGLAGTKAENFEWKNHSPAEHRTANVENGALFPYVRNSQVYICPSTEDARNKELGYSMNCAISGLHDMRMTSPAEIVVLVDEGKSLNDGFFWAVNDPGGDHEDEMTRQHNGGGNLLFADGHAKFFVFNAFPLDASAAGVANKTRMTGSPRFHDKTFGSAGGSARAGADFNSAAPPPATVGLRFDIDSCAQ